MPDEKEQQEKSDEERQEIQAGIHGEPRSVSVKVSIDRSESYIYSNIASVTLSPMDIRIDFADATVEGKTKTVAGITMSPEHAAGLVIILTQQLKHFEKQFGAIRSPQWKAMKQSPDNVQEALPASASKETKKVNR
jgi:hypothetical protein